MGLPGAAKEQLAVVTRGLDKNRPRAQYDLQLGIHGGSLIRRQVAQTINL